MDTQQATETLVVEGATTAQAAEENETTQVVVETISLEEAKKLRQEAHSLRRRMHEFEAKAKAEEDAKLSETERLRKKLDEAQAALKAKELADMRLKAAKAAGLAEVLADRLQGETEDDLAVDALTLAKAMPKVTAVISATNPGVQPRLSQEAIARMTPDEINKNWEAVSAALVNR
jgi:hypothetical protein